MKITLAKSLKLKNRLTTKLAKVRQGIMTCNSILVGNKRQIDINESMNMLAKLQDAIINLKTAIYQANSPIQPIILLNAEIKGEIEFLRAINTNEGKVCGGYMENRSDEYQVVLDYKMVSGLIQNLENSLDKNQDTIDNHNHTTFIDVDDYVIQLLN